MSFDETSAAAVWLRGHAVDAPPALMNEMLGALPTEASDSVADALLTHALQAQAEADPDGLDAFDRRWGAAGALALLTPDNHRA
ncbi:MAG TPA: hypothetical protein VGB15_14310 [Longimicrobium sp.]